MGAAVRLVGCGTERACLLTQANGKTPYPHKFHLTTNFPDFIDKYTNKVQLKEGESDQSASVSLAGRVWSIRNSGKLCFMDLHSDGMKLQVMAQADVLTSGPMPFDDLIATVRRGDIIGVTGAFDTGNPAAELLLCAAPDSNTCVLVHGAGTPALVVFPEGATFSEAAVKRSNAFAAVGRSQRIPSRPLPVVRQRVPARDRS